MDSKVFVTNISGHDFKKAERFGQIIPVTKGYVSFQSLDRLKYDVAVALVDSSPGDYLCLSGTVTICVVAAIVWILKHSEVKLLVYDKKTDDYRVLLINKDNIDKIYQLVSSDENKTPSNT